MGKHEYMTYEEAANEYKASKATIGRYKKALKNLPERYPKECIIGSGKLTKVWYPAIVDYGTNMTALRDKNMRRAFNKRHPFEVTIRSGLCV